MCQSNILLKSFDIFVENSLQNMKLSNSKISNFLQNAIACNFVTKMLNHKIANFFNVVKVKRSYFYNLWRFAKNKQMQKSI